ncbi:MAG: CDP-alcohol phosphatidyltransferase family protein, partial [Isosphaeraceae bacterium]
MSERPTLSELRGRVFKHSAIPSSQFLVPDSQSLTCNQESPTRNPEIGNWLARRVGRPSAVYGTWLAIRLGLSAHQVTLAALVIGGAAALAIASGSRFGFVAGVVLAHLAFWLDHVDGQVARWRGSTSLDGVYFDYLMHHAFALTQGFALGYGLAAHTGDPRWAAAGFATALGWSFLGLQNDCRYKSFFQKLKRESRRFRVDGGA